MSEEEHEQMTELDRIFDEEDDEDLSDFDTLNDQLAKSVREFLSSQEVYEDMLDKAWADMIAAQKKLVEFSRSAISRKVEYIKLCNDECDKRLDRIQTLNRRMLMARKELDGSAESERIATGKQIMEASKTSGKRKCDASDACGSGDIEVW